jgi:hypothetical protein
MDLYRLNNFNYTFTALSTSVLLGDAVSSQCYAIIINASEPVFIKITGDGGAATAGSCGYFIKDWPHYIRVSPGDRIAGLRAGSSDSVVYITELTR